MYRFATIAISIRAYRHALVSYKTYVQPKLQDKWTREVRREQYPGRSGLFVFALALFCLTSYGRADETRVQKTQSGILLRHGHDVVMLDMATDNVVRVHVEPNSEESPRTLVMDPSLQTKGSSPTLQSLGEERYLLSAPGLKMWVDAKETIKLRLCAAAGQCLEMADVVQAAKSSTLSITRDDDDLLYGMRGTQLVDDGRGFASRQGAAIAAGVQGDGGAPFFFTRHYGILVDSDGGAFETAGRTVRFTGSSRHDLEFFVVFGPPMTTISAFMKLTGLPQMPPKWTLGFINSQWGTNQSDLEQVVATYRQKQVPLDVFILDFDWKAWGEDHYGEWRWNSTIGPGSMQPNKFPDGASGVLAARLASQGVKLAGILKPRILLTTAGESNHRMEAAAYADEHHLWYPDEIPEEDYVTHRMARNLDFNLEQT